MLQVSVLRHMFGEGEVPARSSLWAESSFWHWASHKNQLGAEIQPAASLCPFSKEAKSPLEMEEKPASWQWGLISTILSMAGGDPQLHRTLQFFNWCRNWVGPFLSLLQFHQLSRSFHGTRSFHDNLPPAWMITSRPLCSVFQKRFPFVGKSSDDTSESEHGICPPSPKLSVLSLWIAVVNNRSGRQLAYLNFYGILIILGPSGKRRGRCRLNWHPSIICSLFNETCIGCHWVYSSFLLWALHSKKLRLCRRPTVTQKRGSLLDACLGHCITKQVWKRLFLGFR